MYVYIPFALSSGWFTPKTEYQKKSHTCVLRMERVNWTCPLYNPPSPQKRKKNLQLSFTRSIVRQKRLIEKFSRIKFLFLHVHNKFRTIGYNILGGFRDRRAEGQRDKVIHRRTSLIFSIHSLLILWFRFWNRFIWHNNGCLIDTNDIRTV